MTQPDHEPRSALMAALQELIDDWQEIALELRARADRRSRNDLETGYMYGLADGYERNAKKIAHIIKTQQPQGEAKPAVE